MLVEKNCFEFQLRESSTVSIVDINVKKSHHRIEVRKYKNEKCPKVMWTGGNTEYIEAEDFATALRYSFFIGCYFDRLYSTYKGEFKPFIDFIVQRMNANLYEE